ncbi:MAG: MarR family transcriptional regulator [Chloroflexi bacterium]|nr:MarR family transcriptional regulator [Chloroflexota bacterium]
MDRGEELRYLMLAAQREGSRQLAEALRPLNLTPAQAEVLQVLAHYPPMTLLQLGERLVCETGSPSRLVTSMVEAGLVEKRPNPQDGRAVLLRLTPAAEAILPALHRVEAQYHASVGAVLNEDALALVTEHLWAFVAETPSGQALQRRKTRT